MALRLQGATQYPEVKSASQSVRFVSPTVRLAVGFKFGMPVRDALMNLTDRVPLVDVKFFLTEVMQRETGGNLAEILDNFSYVIRERFKIQRQVRRTSYRKHGRRNLASVFGNLCGVRSQLIC